MRWGELAGLRRRNLDLDAQSGRIDETVYELGPLVKGTPKSEAGKRKVAIPELIISRPSPPPGARRRGGS
jgi:hypothetical protein